MLERLVVNFGFESIQAWDDTMFDFACPEGTTNADMNLHMKSQTVTFNQVS